MTRLEQIGNEIAEAEARKGVLTALLYETSYRLEALRRERNAMRVTVDSSIPTARPDDDYERSCLNKRQYRSIEAAGAAAAHRNGAEGADLALRTYQCRYCQKWHLTKVPLEVFAKVNP